MWLVYVLISCIPAGFAGMGSTQFFAKRVFNKRAWVYGYEYRGYERILAWHKTKRYDDSSYERRYAPHGDDYWYGFLLTLVFFVSYPVWLITKAIRWRKKKLREAWRTAKIVRDRERILKAAADAEAAKIVAELTKEEDA